MRQHTLSGGFRAGDNEIRTSIWTIYMTILNFYEKPAVLDRTLHRNLRLKASPNGFTFAATTVAIPLAIVEFPQALLDYPIVFAVGDKGPGAPVALVGVREKENLFVDASGKWLGNYVPAFVRRYPFVLNIDPETKDPLVLVDEAFDGLSQTEGDRLFNEDGSETDVTKSMLSFLGDFKMQGEYSNQFMERLKKYNLLEPQAVVVNRGEEPQITLDGFHIVNEKRLNELDDAATLELARSGDLARIHTHLLSLNNIQRVVQRLSEKMAPVAASTPAAA
jgi:hypothetical protein